MIGKLDCGGGLPNKSISIPLMQCFSAHGLLSCRIKDSTIVIAGFLTGVAHELVKNLVLKGVGTIVLLTWPTQEVSFDTPRLLFRGETRGEGASSSAHVSSSSESMGMIIKEQAHGLNPSVTLYHHHLTSAKEVISGGYLTKDMYNIGMFFLINETTYEGGARELGEACHKEAIPFQWLLTRTMQALLISDLGPSHVYEEERRHVDPETGEFTSEIETKTAAFISLDELWSKHRLTSTTTVGGDGCKMSKVRPTSFSSLFKEIQGQIETGTFFPTGDKVLNEVPAVNAIMGAIAAQEAIKVVTHKDLPIHNVVLFDGSTLGSTIISVS